MKILSLLLHLIGLVLIYVGLEMSIRLQRADSPFPKWYKNIEDPNLVLILVSTMASILFTAMFFLRLKRYRDDDDIRRSMISFFVIFLTVSVLFGMSSMDWGLPIAAGTAIGSILANPFRLTRIGTMETLLRLIPVSALCLHVVLSLEAGRSWSVSLFMLADSTVLYLSGLYVLMLSPILYAPLARLKWGISEYKGCTILKFIIPAVLITLIPIGQYDILVPILTLSYLSCLMVMYGRYVRSLCGNRISDSEVNIRRIVDSSGLTPGILAMVLPEDVYKRIFRP